MTTEPPTAPDEADSASSAARRPLSRRRFLAIVGGTAGAVGVAGLTGRSLLAGPGSPAPVATGQTAGSASVDSSTEIVEVEPGFADATVWNGQLLTLRADSTGSGIVLRSETDGQEHPVDAPPDFTARCIGTIDETLVVGGHMYIEGEAITYEAGPDALELLRYAGAEAAALASQPGMPEFERHMYTPRRMAASLVATDDLRRWEATEIAFPDRTGGSVAGVLERTGSFALDHYESPEAADSNFEATLLDARSALGGVAAFDTWVLPVDHGLIWGVTSADWGDIVIVADRRGVRAMDDRGQHIFEFEDAFLYAVQPIVSEFGEVVAVGTLGASGVAATRLFRDGEEILSIDDALLTSHQIGPTLSLTAPAGKIGGAMT